MSETALKIQASSPKLCEIGEGEPPESAVRKLRTQVHTPDPAYDFYDELTEPLWNPPLLQPLVEIGPTLEPKSEPYDPAGRPTYPPSKPPFLSIWRRLWMALTGN